MINICPVCGFSMRYPARDWNICPSCGTEFGYDDAGRSHEALRDDWITRGMKWWSLDEFPPFGWSPLEQLTNVVVLRPQGYSVPLAYNNNSTLTEQNASNYLGIPTLVLSPLSSANIAIDITGVL